MTLKTLKDLKRYCKSDYSEGTIGYEELRREAIKWIEYLTNTKADFEKNFEERWKSFNHTSPTFRSNEDLWKEGTKRICIEEQKEANNQITWIKHFFNILEEELK